MLERSPDRVRVPQRDIPQRRRGARAAGVTARERQAHHGEPRQRADAGGEQSAVASGRRRHRGPTLAITLCEPCHTLAGVVAWRYLDSFVAAWRPGEKRLNSLVSLQAPDSAAVYWR